MVNEEILRGWIQEYRICWECSPLVEMHEQHRVQIGFELHLFAQHPGQGAQGPGCSLCRELYNELRELALFALPTDVRPSRYEIDPYRPAFHYRAETNRVPECQLTLRVLHREGYFEPIDACETRCADEITSRLCALGAQPNAWTAGSLST